MTEDLDDYRYRYHSLYLNEARESDRNASRVDTIRSPRRAECSAGGTDGRASDTPTYR